MKKTLAMLVLAVTTMFVVTGCVTGNSYEMTQEQAITNLHMRVAYLRDRDIRWQACVKQQAIQNALAQQQAALAQQRVAAANLATETALRTAEEAVRTAEKIKKRQPAITHELNMGTVKKPTSDKLRDDIAILEGKIKKVQNNLDDLVIQIRSSYGTDAITKLQKELEANELALKELEEELFKKIAELKKL